MMNVQISPGFIRFFFFGILLLLTCSVSAGSLSDRMQSTPESWNQLDTEALNIQIQKAVKAGEAWSQSPLKIVLHLFGGDLEARLTEMREEKDNAEDTGKTTVNYIRDGFLDDSVRGDWHRVELERLKDGSWRIRKAKAAYRCWRGENTEAYRGKPCP